MSIVINPLEISPTGYPTKITFYGGEGLQWVAEVNARTPHGTAEMRMRLIFSGTAQVRIGAYEDQDLQGAYLLALVPNSVWVADHLDAYVKKFGPALLPVVKNIKHYVLRGHEFSIGLLARNVECLAAEDKQ